MEREKGKREMEREKEKNGKREKINKEKINKNDKKLYLYGRGGRAWSNAQDLRPTWQKSCGVVPTWVRIPPPAFPRIRKRNFFISFLNIFEGE